MTAWTEEGEPIYTRFAELRKEGEQWEFDRDELVADYWEGEKLGFPLPDLRSLALLPRPVTYMSASEALWIFPEGVQSARKYRERVVDGIHEVEMHLPDIDTTIKWYVDPELGWNPVRCEMLYQGEIVNECLPEYELLNGIWFPVTVTYLNSVGDMVSLIDVDSVQLNSADIPRDLSPDILGLGNGMAVLPQSGKRPRRGLTYGTGGRLFTSDEYLGLVKAGKIESDPRLAEKLRRALEAGAVEGADEAPERRTAPQPPAPASQPAIVPNRVDDAWEKYTRGFIQRYRLNDEQTQKAWSILRDCQRQRTSYLRSRREQIGAFEERLLLKKSAADRDELLRKLEELRKPIERIFEERLKPRLDKLPTRAQRKAAETTSQPSGAKGRD